MLSELRPTILRFLADAYDDTTSTIFPLLSSILGTVSSQESRQREILTENFAAEKDQTIISPRYNGRDPSFPFFYTCRFATKTQMGRGGV